MNTQDKLNLLPGETIKLDYRPMVSGYMIFENSPTGDCSASGVVLSKDGDNAGKVAVIVHNELDGPAAFLLLCRFASPKRVPVCEAAG